MTISSPLRLVKTSALASHAEKVIFDDLCGRIHQVQAQISQHPYRTPAHEEAFSFNVDKTRNLSEILGTAAEIAATASIGESPAPIKCVEAVFLALHYTEELLEVARVPVSFTTKDKGTRKAHKHIVLAVLASGHGCVDGMATGALGLSREANLMYKPLRQRSFSALISDYERSFREHGHQVVSIRFGLPVARCRENGVDPDEIHARMNSQVPWCHVEHKVQSRSSALSSRNTQQIDDKIDHHAHQCLKLHHRRPPS